MTGTTCPAPPTTRPDAPVDPTARAFLVGFVQTLLVPLSGLAALLVAWALAHATGGLAATAAVTGWSVLVVAWLRRRGWPAATAHLIGWAAPAVLLAAMAGLGSPSADGLVLWAPVGTVLAVALAAASDPDLVTLPARRPRAG